MSLQKYRKKPVTIEAIQWNGDNFHTIVDIFGLNKVSLTTGFQIIIPTLEGSMLANIGDWIIKGVKDELYLCKPDIFELTYEVVNNE